MDDSISEHALQMAAEVFGYDNIGEVPNDLIIDVYDNAQWIVSNEITKDRERAGWGELEVIGNIYQNPDLARAVLKKKETNG